MKLKKIVRRISLLTAALILCGSVQTMALELPDVVGELVDAYLPVVEEELGVEIGSFEMISEAITELLDTDWFGDMSLEEKAEKLQTILETMGIPEEYITVTMDNIMTFVYDGQEYYVLLEQIKDDLVDLEIWGAAEYEQEYELYGHVNQNAFIAYGLGFDKFENSLVSLGERWTESGMDTEIDKSVTVEEFKTNMLDQDLIIIEEHGDFEFMGIPMICTMEKYNKKSADEYESDIESGRVFVVVTSDGVYYYIHPSFFSYYYGNGKLEGSMVWIGACSGYKNSALADAFLSSGASTVIGHSETVYTLYDYYMLEAVIGGMINGKDADDALAEAKETWGENDIQFAEKKFGIDADEMKTEIAYPRLGGSSSLVFR